MNAFTFYNPTKVFFGQGMASNIHTELEQYGKTVLLTYGGGSIKHNGIYSTIQAELQAAGKNVIEFSGIMSNPRMDKVLEGVSLCKKHNIDFILAVGGGSTIDCSKIIAAATMLDNPTDFWDLYMTQRLPVTKALPLGAVLTMSATGSEMNSRAVITNTDTHQKLGARGDALFPKFSILDPTYTYSLPKEQMIYGIVDMLSHLMEQYFSEPDETNLTDDLIEATFKSIMKNAAIAIENPEDYVARSNLMWGATLGLNGIFELGKGMDWTSHQIEHTLSAFYDIPHGAGLAIIHPMMLNYIYKDHLARFVQFAKNIWNIDSTDKTEEELALVGINALRDYFKSIGAPTTLNEVHIPESAIPEMAATTRRFKTTYTDFTITDIENIMRSALY